MLLWGAYAFISLRIQYHLENFPLLRSLALSIANMADKNLSCVEAPGAVCT